MWENVSTHSVGGLENIGYAPDQDYVIVLSSQGQGIFDCLSGERIARLNNDSDWWEKFDRTNNSIVGFDILDGVNIITFGIYSKDDLRKSTKDGWRLEFSPHQIDANESSKIHSQEIYLALPEINHKEVIYKDGPCELRAFGFSDTGKSLIVASSCELIIYSR